MTTKTITPNSFEFGKYIDETIKPILEQNYKGSKVFKIMTLLNYLEKMRYDFSKDRAFQTRPIAMEKIAEYFRVEIRTVQRWFEELENLGIVERVFRKNKHHKYKNLLNVIRLSSFKAWFAKLLKKQNERKCRPNKKDILHISIKDKNSLEKKKTSKAFPKNGSIRYDETWKALAETHLPSGKGRPCMDTVAQRFRENLKKHGIALNDRSIKARWIKFCQRANSTSSGGAEQAMSGQEVNRDNCITIEKPVFDLSNPFENLSQYMFDKSAQTWVSWIKPLKATLEGEMWVVSAPSEFHARYVVENFGDALRGYLGRVELRTV